MSGLSKPPRGVHAGSAFGLLAAVFVTVFGTALLLLADVLGRVVALPGEVQAGIVVAFLGAPLLVALVLQPRRVAL